MRIYELSPSQSRHLQKTDFSRSDPEEIEEWLVSNGFKQVDTGYYAAVYRKGNSEIVVKVATTPDPCYLKFVKYVEKNKGNPHLPKIAGLREMNLEAYGDDMFIIYIERLEKIKKAQLSILMPLIELAMDYFDWRNMAVPDSDSSNEKNAWKDELRKQIDETPGFADFLKNNKKFITTVIDIKKYFKNENCAWDLWKGNLSKNIMVRSSTKDLVIIDPIASFEE